MKLTVLISQGEEMLVGQVREVPGVMTQGASIDEVMENIQDALEMYFQDTYTGETATNSELNLKDVAAIEPRFPDILCWRGRSVMKFVSSSLSINIDLSAPGSQRYFLTNSIFRN